MYKKLAMLVVVFAMLLSACGAPATTQAPPPPATTEAPAMTEAPAATEAPAMAETAKATPGKSLNMVFLPKFLGNAVFDQAHEGALEAAAELKNPAELQFLAPASGGAGTDQIPIITNATTQGVDAIMLSNNAGDQVAPAAQAARDAGVTFVTWDSPIPSAEGEQVFVAQVDFAETGKVMADMARDILGPNGGKFAILSAGADSANQNAWIDAMKEVLKDPAYSNLELLDVVYGNDESEKSTQEALALVDKYPDMQLIMAPTTVGIAAAAKAMQDEGLCDKVKVSGLGLPAEMVSFVKNGCSPEFALWSFHDLGYLTYYVSYMLASGDLKAEDGAKFDAGRMGEYTITKDPTRPDVPGALRVLMGPFSKYDASNIDQEVGGAAAAPAKATPGKSLNMVFLPKFLGNAVFDEAHAGAQAAAKDLQNPAELQFLAPASGGAGTDQIPIITNATTQGVDAIMLSNNAGDQVAPAAQAARDAGITFVTWDSPIPSAEGEQLFVAQVDFKETGKVMADMARDILGPDGGKFAILSAGADSANQNAWIDSMKEVLKDPAYSNLELLDVVYGNDETEKSTQEALALVDKYPDMQLIMAPTTVGIAAAAKAMQDEGLCDKVKVSGLGLPAEMVSFVKNGCSPEFALWSFYDLGYLTYYVSYMLASGDLKAEDGAQFDAGRMGIYTITKDPTRPDVAGALRVLMGPFSKYDASNIDKAVNP